MVFMNKLILSCFVLAGFLGLAGQGTVYSHEIIRLRRR